MITLIGARCKHSDVLSRGVLIFHCIRKFEQSQKNFILPFETKKLRVVCWWLNAGVTPVLIPNTEVKLGSGDDTPLGESS
jgi:hypothetical protein